MTGTNSLSISGRFPPSDSEASTISSMDFVFTQATVLFPWAGPPQPRRADSAYHEDTFQGSPVVMGAAPDSHMNPLIIGSLASAQAKEYMSTARLPADSPNSVMRLGSPMNSYLALGNRQQVDLVRHTAEHFDIIADPFGRFTLVQ